MTKPNLLELSQLEIGFRKNIERPDILLPPITLRVNEGEFIALVGPNGAGKSTLLRTLSALIPQISGSILLKNKNLNSYSALERAYLLSIVLTDFPDDYYIKVEDVVATGRYPYIDFWARLKKSDIDCIERSIQLCGIGHLKERTILSLSDGERQKVMIAKALAQDTPLIILDEPAAFLDYPSKIELMQLLQNLVVNENKTVLFSSHDLDLVLRSADRVWLISQGKALVDRIPEQLVLDGTLNAYFDKDDLKYDPYQGQFIFIRNHLNNVCVTNDNLHTKWLKNALIRKGFNVASRKDSEIIITYNSDHFLVEYQSKYKSYTTIETLIYDLQNLKK